MHIWQQQAIDLNPKWCEFSRLAMTQVRERASPNALHVVEKEGMRCTSWSRLAVWVARKFCPKILRQLWTWQQGWCCNFMQHLQASRVAVVLAFTSCQFMAAFQHSATHVLHHPAVYTVQRYPALPRKWIVFCLLLNTNYMNLGWPNWKRRPGSLKPEGPANMVQTLECVSYVFFRVPSGRLTYGDIPQLYY
jgi:hypothetical protein